MDLWEITWRGIPLLTSTVVGLALPGAVMLTRKGESDWHRYQASLDTRSMMSARLLRLGAWLRLIALTLIFFSGILFGVGTWSLPVPPRQGTTWLLWVNHVMVMTMSFTMAYLSHLNAQTRKHL